MVDDKKKNGGKPARIGRSFDREAEEIKMARLDARTDKEKISTEKISNLIVRHKDWKTIKQAIINATKEEVEKHGLE